MKNWKNLIVPNNQSQAMNLKEKQQVTANWFKNLRDQICAEFEKIEAEFAEEISSYPGSPYLGGSSCCASTTNGVQKFSRNNWNRDGGGRGEMSVMKGNVFEKVGVNFSEVHGEFSEEFRKEIPGAGSGKFWASGISLVAHMASPLVPAAHFNTRFICTEKEWFGGGGDLNPMFEVEQDTDDFHQAFKTACDKASPDYYEKYKKWCDEYFFIKHRGVARGIGGIFYDYLNSGSFEKDFEFTRDVGLAFKNIFSTLVRRHMFENWTQEQREYQLKKRGFYTEFNLLYDRGTRFGLMTGGNTEAILMSLPPVAKWD